MLPPYEPPPARPEAPSRQAACLLLPPLHFPGISARRPARLHPGPSLLGHAPDRFLASLLPRRLGLQLLLFFSRLDPIFSFPFL